jgi:hypothetical protein
VKSAAHETLQDITLLVCKYKPVLLAKYVTFNYKYSSLSPTAAICSPKQISCSVSYFIAAQKIEYFFAMQRKNEQNRWEILKLNSPET